MDSKANLTFDASSQKLDTFNDRMSSLGPSRLRNNDSIVRIERNGMTLDLNKPVGPGNYDMPALTGRSIHVSSKRNFPMISLSHRTDPNNKVMITKEHTSMIMGRDSPGVGTYTYDYSKLANKILSNHSRAGSEFSIGNQRKFFQFKESEGAKEMLPHSYASIFAESWKQRPVLPQADSL